MVVKTSMDNGNQGNDNGNSYQSGPQDGTGEQWGKTDDNDVQNQTGPQDGSGEQHGQGKRK